MKFRIFLVFCLFISTSFMLKAEFDIKKIDKTIEKIEIPDFSLADKNKEVSIPKLSLGMIGNLPQNIESLNIAEAPLKLRGGKNVYASKADSVVKIITKDGGSGSGAIISKDGFIVTNWHVVMGNTVVGVILLSDSKTNPSNPKFYYADVIRTDPKVDLALIKLQEGPRNLLPFSFGNIPDIGSDVHAIGHPIGEDWTYTRGYISQIRKNYNWTYADGSAHIAEVIQTQTPINPGNSGGPLISDNGKLVGINSFGSSSAEGINFSVSINTVREFLAKEETEIGDIVDPASFWGCVDSNNNGKNDTCGFDLNGDEVIDVISIDNDEDGYADEYQLVDYVNDEFVQIGWIKPIMQDGNIIMLWLLDHNSDGEAEQYGLDYDRNGRPDFFKEIS